MINFADQEIRNKTFLRYTALSCVVAALNVLFYTNHIISLFIAAAEVLILFYQLVKGKIVRYLSFYLIFMCHCIEFSQFVNDGVVYNLKNFRILGINLGVWLLVPVILKIVFKPIKVGLVKKTNPLFFKCSKHLIIMNVLATVIGVTLIAVNDNQIQRIDNIGIEFIGVFFSMFFLLITSILSFYEINSNERDEMYLIPIALQVILWGSTFQFIISYVFGIYGNYASVKMLASSIMYFILPLGLLFGIDKGHCFYPKINLLVILLGTIMTFSFNTNGKSVLLLGFIFIVWFLYFLRSKTLTGKLFLPLLLLVVVLVVPYAVSFFSKNILFSSKFNQAMSMIRFWDRDWLVNMAHSPKMRVAELLNTVQEFVKKPWLFFTGKGYMGSIKDYLDMFGTMETSRGAFSNKEWIAGVFYNMHEFTTIILMYGLPGIAFMIELVSISVKNYRKDIWIVIGTVWFVLLYGYSFTLGLYGTFVLMYALSSIDNLY